MRKENNQRQVKKSAATIKNYKDAFSSVPGKKVLLDLIRKHEVLEPYLDEDPLMLAQQNGARAVVLGILKMMRQDENKLLADYDKYLAEEQQEELS